MSNQAEIQQEIVRLKQDACPGCGSREPLVVAKNNPRLLLCAHCGAQRAKVTTKSVTDRNGTEKEVVKVTILSVECAQAEKNPLGFGRVFLFGFAFALVVDALFYFVAMSYLEPTIVVGTMLGIFGFIMLGTFMAAVIVGGVNQSAW